LLSVGALTVTTMMLHRPILGRKDKFHSSFTRGSQRICYRFVAVSEQEIQIGKRIRLVRREQRISERLAARQMGLSRDQLRRIERGEVAVRFFAAWNFCQFSNTNPLWLAFGESDGRHGFVTCANSTLPDDARFLEILQKYGSRYRRLRFLTHESWFGAAAVFSDDDKSILGAEFIALPRDLEESSKKVLGRSEIKRYLIRHMATTPEKWEDLRIRLVSATQSRAAKKHLATGLGVTLAAISQWRSGASAPTADKTLRLLRWVEQSEAKQKKSAGSVSEARPARKTRERKSRSNAKPKSSREKH
jgi:transcriptional regulator with XRE-family HTH domain